MLKTRGELHDVYDDESAGEQLSIPFYHDLFRAVHHFPSVVSTTHQSIVSHQMAALFSLNFPRIAFSAVDGAARGKIFYVFFNTCLNVRKY